MYSMSQLNHVNIKLNDLHIEFIYKKESITIKDYLSAKQSCKLFSII